MKAPRVGYESAAGVPRQGTRGHGTHQARIPEALRGRGCGDPARPAAVRRRADAEADPARPPAGPPRLARLPFADALMRSPTRLAPSASLTTLARTIVRGEQAGAGTRSAYHRLTFGEGEPFIRRTELGPVATSPIRLASSFVQ